VGTAGVDWVLGWFGEELHKDFGLTFVLMKDGNISHYFQ
jgi:hypothetical protein